MVKFERIPIEEAKAIKRQMKMSPKTQEYEEALLDLSEGEAIRVDTRLENEKPQTIKNRIIRIGKYHGMKNLKVQRRNGTITFWLEKKKAKDTSSTSESPKTEEQSLFHFQ